MSVLCSPVRAEKGAELIAGYVLQEQIGSGGYGEVWKATAPGGMAKALKLVFGRHSDARAARELKALDRIKDLSHPFLISVERIEVANDTLIIVTELAQRNLKQRFQDSVQQGQVGIPRDELLSYMRDAADALDYLWNEESLQHLDIKPENILLVGRHAKIGDFGLVKDLQDNSASLVAGLTPQYSPPELFCNHPDRRSDQYSLAIVFQEMLTGKVPFDGKTPAALALQHVQGEPDLTSLPPSDRFAVGKALSKLPENRFASCTEFVESLLKAAKSTVTYLGAGDKESSTPRPASKLESLLKENNGRPNDGHTLALNKPRCQGLGQIDLATTPECNPPTLFVGLGGFAGAVLSDLRRRLDDRFGSLAAVPAIQTLWLDTAPATSDAAKTTDYTNLSESDTEVLSLKSAQDYRRSNLDALKSVSRRWIYNIPRSGSTEGFRPLGRLALLTHAERILQVLRKRLRSITDSEVIKQCKLASRYSVTTTVPQVIVVASINGGSGGGMLIDCGYAARQVLAELCLSDENLRCVLVNSPAEHAHLRGLGIANAYCCLDELDYFSRPDTIYPGEPSVGLLGFQGSEGPFRTISVADFGDQCVESRHKLAGRVAEYLYLNVEPKASRFFHEVRKLEDNKSTNCRSRARSFGLYSFSESHDELVNEFCEMLCTMLITGWRGRVGGEADQRPLKLTELNHASVLDDEQTRRQCVLDAEVTTQLARQGVREAELKERVHLRVATALGERTDTYFRRIIETSLKNARSVEPVYEALTTIGFLCGDRVENVPVSRIESIPEAVGKQLDDDAKALADSLSRWALSLVDNPGIRVEGAKYVVVRLREELTGIQRAAAAIQQQQETAIRSLRSNLAEQLTRAAGKVRPPQIREWVELLTQYADARVKEVCASLSVKMLGIVEASINSTADALRDMWRDLNALASLFRAPADGENTGVRFEGELKALWNQLYGLRYELMQHLDRAIDVVLVPVDSTHRASVFESADQQRGLIARMKQAARQVTLRAVRDLQSKTIGQMVVAASQTRANSLRKCLATAEPSLTACGGGKRTLVVLPPGMALQQFAAEVAAASGDKPTVLEDSDQNAVICAELGGLELKSIAQHVVGHRPEIVEMAKRVRSRLDVTF